MRSWWGGTVVAGVLELPAKHAEFEIEAIGLIYRFAANKLTAVPLESSSSFSRYGHRDERRRRLLTDDLGETVDGAQCKNWPENATAAKLERYGNADFLKQQMRLSDLIPRRFFVQFMFFVAGAAVIAGLEIAYTWMCQQAAAGNALVASLDVDAKGSLACWFSSLLLTASAVGSLVVYGVRRHRIDDYQGRYRVWLWAAVVWFLAATDLAASLHEWFQRAMISLSGTTLVGDGTAWWVAVYAILFGAVGSRLFLDMRPSRLSTIVFVTATIVCGLAFSARWNWAFSQNAIAAVLFQTSCTMTGCLLLLLAVSLYARHVLLDAEGLLPIRKTKPKTLKIATSEAEKQTAEKTKVSSTTGNTWRKIDPPQPTPPQPHQPVYQATPATRVVSVHPAFATPSPAVSTASTTSADHKLTKAERKALKERLLRERRERERG